MNYLFYDVESTGLTNSDEVVQFAGILTDENLRLQRAYSFYCYTPVPMSKKVSEITGLSATILHKLSEMQTFEDQFFQLSLHKLKDLTWIAYSTNHFDERMINYTLEHNGLPRYDFGTPLPHFDSRAAGIHTIDAYHLLQNRCFGGRNQKLSQAIASVPGGELEVRELFDAKLASASAVRGYHDALYDSLTLWWLLNHFKSRLGINEL